MSLLFVNVSLFNHRVEFVSFFFLSFIKSRLFFQTMYFDHGFPTLVWNFLIKMVLYKCVRMLV